MVNIDGKQTNNEGQTPMATATNKAGKLQTAHIDNFYINPENVRKLENYQVAEMITKIMALGKVLVPTFALAPDTEGDNKGKRLVGDGNRRTRALQIISFRAKAQAEGKLDLLKGSIAGIEANEPNGKAMAVAAENFDYSAVDLNLPFIEITKEQAESEKEMLKLQLVTGSSAVALTPSEYAAGVLKLLAENDGNEDLTAIDIGKDKVWVQKIARVYVGINKDDKMLGAIEEGRIDVDLADQIGAFARKNEMPLGSAVEEVLAAALARNKTKATRKDLDSVKAAHAPKPPADPATGATGQGAASGGGAGGGAGDGGKPKTVKPRKDALDGITEFVKFLTLQAQNGFANYSDEDLSAMATKAESFHNLMIKAEKAKEEAPTTEAPVTPVTTPEAVVTPAVESTPEVVAAVATEDKEPAIAQ